MKVSTSIVIYAVAALLASSSVQSINNECLIGCFNNYNSAIQKCWKNANPSKCKDRAKDNRESCRRRCYPRAADPGLFSPPKAT
ncbi:MAG: hypothetical protein J3Q66DRAFT_332704 [Benniella sp.]|nr:MAG: hypothetical protein J3Q66DRAFT_332704 [Benniella sp.]